MSRITTFSQNEIEIDEDTGVCFALSSGRKVVERRGEHQIIKQNNRVWVEHVPSGKVVAGPWEGHAEFIGYGALKELEGGGRKEPSPKSPGGTLFSVGEQRGEYDKDESSEKEEDAKKSLDRLADKG